MTDDEAVALVEFEVKITGGRLSMLGATDRSDCPGLARNVLRGMEERQRVSRYIDPAAILDMN